MYGNKLKISMWH